MNNVNCDDIVVSFWAIGPTFIHQLKRQLTEYLTNNLGDVFKFTILTDQPDKFEYIHTQTDKCLTILNIHEERSRWDWSVAHEAIPSGVTDREYTIQFRQNLAKGKRFSYSLHRFALPWMIRNNYTKFIIIDPDVRFTFKHIDIESLQDYTNAFFNKGEVPHISRNVNYVIGSSYFEGNSTLYTNFYDAIVLDRGLLLEYPTMFHTTDGPFRFYNFNSVEMTKDFFEIWNSAVHLMLTTPKLNEIGHGSVFLNDEFLLGAIYAILDIQVAPISSAAVSIEHRVENRYFMPSTGTYKLTDTLQEFIEINKEELTAQYSGKFNVTFCDID